MWVVVTLIANLSDELDLANIPHYFPPPVNTLERLRAGAKPRQVLNVKKSDIQHIPYDKHG